MLSRSQIKHARSLHLKKNRNRHKAYLVEGDKICKEILLSHPTSVKSIFATSSWLDTNQDLIKITDNRVFNATLTQLQQMTTLKTAPKIILEMTMPVDKSTTHAISETPIFFLDRIQDPGNMGTILRISDWFGFGYIVLSPGCVDLYNSKVLQSAMTSHLRVKSMVSSLKDFKDEYPNFQVYVADVGGEDIRSVTIPHSDVVIVIGNEGQGVDPSISYVADKVISISGDRRLGAESLNAGISAGIIAYQSSVSKRYY